MMHAAYDQTMGLGRWVCKKSGLGAALKAFSLSGKSMGCSSKGLLRVLGFPKP